jgi:hypothetical protein
VLSLGQPVYLPLEAGNAPLPANGDFPIGYGESSVRPLSFSIPNKEPQDIGFLRLFLSESYVAMGAVEQAAFSNAIKRDFLFFDDGYDDDKDRWDARTIIVRAQRNVKR